MEPRFNMFDNDIGARFSKRFASASMVIAQSPLPKSTQELVGLRASQINGCGWCVDLHTKEAAADGETAVRLNLVAAWREAAVFTEAEQAARPPAEPFPQLTQRQREILDGVAAGLTNAQIGQQMFLSAKTVANNVSNILAKLQLAERAQAIIAARDAGLAGWPNAIAAVLPGDSPAAITPGRDSVTPGVGNSSAGRASLESPSRTARCVRRRISNGRDERPGCHRANGQRPGSGLSRGDQSPRGPPR